MIYVYPHARQRWIERIDPGANDNEAHTAILAHSVAIAKAAAFGASRLKLPGNIILGLDGENVITVFRPEDWGNVPRRRRREIARKAGHR